LQNFFILRATRTVTPARIPLVTMKELSAVLAECAARTEIARAGVEEARKGIEVATKKQEEIRAEVEKLRPPAGPAAAPATEPPLRLRLLRPEVRS
jgi:hypothetical protein